MVKTIYDRASYDEIIKRINVLTPAADNRWGTMSAAQMLAHSKTGR